MSVAFPTTYRLTKQSTIEVADNVLHDRMDDGTLHSRKLGDNTHETVRCEVAALSQTDYVSLKAFVKANRTNDITMTLDGLNYTGRITSNLRIQKRGGWFFAVFDYYATTA